MSFDPFTNAATASKNISQGLSQWVDTSALDQILKQASETPEQQENVMQQILSKVSPERQQAAMQILQQRTKAMQQQKGGTALANILEKPELAEQFSQLPLDLQKEVTRGILEQKKQLMIQAAKAPEQPKLSPPTQQYLKDLNKKFEAADVVADVGERMMSLVDSISAGKGTIQGKSPAIFKSPEVAEFESLTFDLLPHYKSMFPRGITNAEFKKISEGALPKLGLSPKANKARIQKFMDRANKVLKQKGSIESIQEKLGFIPENVQSLLSKDEKKPGLESLPDPKTIPIGKKIRDTETGVILINNGTDWVKESEMQGQ